MLQRLIYVSKCLAGPRTAFELNAILQVSRERNAQNGITGVLLYRGNIFLQLLEGRPEAVAATFARIERDPRHREVTKLVDEPAGERFFDLWNMRFQSLSDEEADLIDEALGWRELILWPTAIPRDDLVGVLRRFTPAEA